MSTPFGLYGASTMRKRERDTVEDIQDTITVLSKDSHNNNLASRPITRLLLHTSTLSLLHLKTNQYTITSLQPIQRIERKDNMP
jgi:hypothetical protein